MEKETELYLMERIRLLENENAYLKGQVKGYEEKEKVVVETRCRIPFSKEDMVEAFKNDRLLPATDVETIYLKACAFEKIQEILNLAVANWVEQKRYTLYTTKPYIKKQIDIEIDEKTFKQLWEAFQR